MNKESHRVFMICENEEVRADCAAMLKRVSSSMSAVEMFSNKMADLDEDAPNLTAQVGPILERLLLTLMQIDPNGPGQMQEDIKSTGDFTVRSLNELKEEKNDTRTNQ